MDTNARIIHQNLAKLVLEYEALETEREFLRTGVAARLAAVNADRQALLAEAQTQLDRLNALRVAAGEPTRTLQEVRASFLRGPRRRA